MYLSLPFNLHPMTEVDKTKVLAIFACHIGMPPKHRMVLCIICLVGLVRWVFFPISMFSNGCVQVLVLHTATHQHTDYTDCVCFSGFWLIWCIHSHPALLHCVHSLSPVGPGSMGDYACGDDVGVLTSLPVDLILMERLCGFALPISPLFLSLLLSFYPFFLPPSSLSPSPPIYTFQPFQITSFIPTLFTSLS